MRLGSGAQTLGFKSQLLVPDLEQECDMPSLPTAISYLLKQGSIMVPSS